MYGLALCLPSVGQPQGLPVPHEIPKTRRLFSQRKCRAIGDVGGIVNKNEMCRRPRLWRGRTWLYFRILSFTGRGGQLAEEDNGST
ncbi:MAG: hypothetical protein V9G20_03780 [Candidatus Promineifilaceae bacterium]